MRILEYDRQAAFEYAKKWAFRRNPRYYNFEKIGGDCTNFASQCIYAGAKVMNFTPTFGWYYISINNRAPAWTGVEYLFNFLTGNDAEGPFAEETALNRYRTAWNCGGRFLPLPRRSCGKAGENLRRRTHIRRIYETAVVLHICPREGYTYFGSAQNQMTTSIT